MRWATKIKEFYGYVLYNEQTYSNWISTHLRINNETILHSFTLYRSISKQPKKAWNFVTKTIYLWIGLNLFSFCVYIVEYTLMILVLSINHMIKRIKLYFQIEYNDRENKRMCRFLI